MNTPQARSVTIEDSDDPAAIQRAVEAAELVFARYRLTPEHCWQQVMAHQRCAAYCSLRGLKAWHDAERAALAICPEGRMVLADLPPVTDTFDRALDEKLDDPRHGQAEHISRGRT